MTCQNMNQSFYTTVDVNETFTCKIGVDSKGKFICICKNGTINRIDEKAWRFLKNNRNLISSSFDEESEWNITLHYG